MIREIQIMEKIKHENCVDLFFIEPENYQNVDLIYVVMEYCDSGDLNEYLRTKSSISLEEVKEIFGQIVFGLKFLYEKDIVHRDLKPKNILLQSNNNSKFGYTIKLADFGFARKIPRNFLRKSIEMDSFIGTRIYAAPEILSNIPYKSNVDLWSLGAILYEIITGNSPIQANGLDDSNRQIKDLPGKKSLPDSYLRIVPKECHDLVERLLTVDPNLRITREELYKHPFIFGKLNELKEKSIDISDLEKKIIGIAKEDFESKENGKLSFKKGEIIEIIEIYKDKGICEGKLKEKEGIIELNRIDLYEEIEDIFSINESNELNNDNDNQLINFEKRIIGITSNEYKSNEISLSRGDLVEINNINKENDSCKIQFGNQKDEIPFFFFGFYERHEEYISIPNQQNLNQQNLNQDLYQDLYQQNLYQNLYQQNLNQNLYQQNSNQDLYQQNSNQDLYQENSNQDLYQQDLYQQDLYQQDLYQENSNQDLYQQDLYQQNSNQQDLYQQDSNQEDEMSFSFINYESSQNMEMDEF
ncbi:serine/threonine-protein kinase ulk3 [Anaeramoeba ignava]|uniref:Serine/threonine-protein kinase ulk3 n=1 Tax=Anaeramoeba ignava TaxID=1746090 RepID=A0A9Q0LMJ1_ANAIG|nr:serine/threonine-protein kinase ulk3 [Anaeramoeba ignava]